MGVGGQEGGHVKPGVGRAIATGRPDRAGAAREAAAVHAGGAGRAADMADAGRHVIAPFAERANGAG